MIFRLLAFAKTKLDCPLLKLELCKSKIYSLQGDYQLLFRFYELQLMQLRQILLQLLLFQKLLMQA